jgi:hypothetical protein
VNPVFETTPIIPSSRLGQAITNQVGFNPGNIMIRRTEKCALWVSQPLLRKESDGGIFGDF